MRDACVSVVARTAWSPTLGYELMRGADDASLRLF
jgi:hypothetical protein